MENVINHSKTNESRYTQKNTLTIALPALLLSLYVAMAFLFHLFTYTFSGTIYCITLFLLVALFAVIKPIVKHGLPSYYLLLWLLALLVLGVNYLLRYRVNAVLIDVVVIFSGFFVILGFSRNSKDYNAALTVLTFMAAFFAFGVYLQRLLPSVYSIIIRIFPARLASSLSAGIGTSGGVRGFTTNVGFTANYIIVGIFAIVASININRRFKMRNIFWIAFLIFALLLTGKRGPLLFLVISFILTYLIPSRGTKRMRKILWIIVVALAVFLLLYIFDDVLAQIPFFGRMIRSVEGYLMGEDITSGRSRLYAWAVQLFLQHPIVGIGWGKYRTTTAGVATYSKSLEVHNVYLQLLCETGIIGFLCFVSIFLVSWVMTKNLYCSCLKETNEELKKWRPALFFSFVFQTYFLLYCLTGNLLYDQFYQILYTFSCSIMVAYKYICKINNLKC